MRSKTIDDYLHCSSANLAVLSESFCRSWSIIKHIALLILLQLDSINALTVAASAKESAPPDTATPTLIGFPILCYSKYFLRENIYIDEYVVYTKVENSFKGALEI